MTLITTPGSGNANSYASAADFAAYHAAVLPDEQAIFENIDEDSYEGLLRTATAILDGSYQWIGRRTNYVDQALEWPRNWVHRDGLWAKTPAVSEDPDLSAIYAYLDATQIPKFLTDATCEFARQLSVRNSRADDDSVNTKMVKVGPIQIESTATMSLGLQSFIPAAVDMLCRKYGVYSPGINAADSFIDIGSMY